MMRHRIYLLLLLLWTGMYASAVLADCGAAVPAPSCGSTPSAVFDGNGRLWVVFVDAGHVYLTHSDDAGDSFSNALPVNREPEPVYADGENRPVIALGSSGEIYVAWTRQNNQPYSGDIRFARSIDGGQHFAPVMTVNDDGLQTSHRFVAMAATASNQLYLAWLDKRDQVAALANGDDYAGAALYYTLSTDGGRSFAANRKVADHSCECCRVAMVATDAAAVSILWRHVFEDGQVRDHALATLTAAGPQPVQRASRDNWRLQGCPHHGPALAAGADGVHMSWFSNGNAKGVLYGKNSLRGDDTAQLATIDPRPAGGHPAIATVGGTLSLVWLSYDGARMNLQLVQSSDDGAHWQAPVTLDSTAAAADHPQLLTYDGRLFAAWHTNLEGYRLLPVEVAPFRYPVSARALDPAGE